MQGLQNISPIDGRYRHVAAPLSAFFSEEALIRYRVLIEVEYFIGLCKIPLSPLKSLNDNDFKKIREIATTFSQEDALAVKGIEQETNHDIKAVEYFIKQRFEYFGYGAYKEFVHFGLTSQDINNTAIPLSFKEALETVIYPALDELLSVLGKLANDWLHVPMLARTHGQPASPTTAGKEIMVFHERLRLQVGELKALPIPAKFGGATGNFNAHHLAYPEVDWVGFGNQFAGSFGLERSRITTQIDHYDRLSSIFDALKRICTILIDLDRDCWSYISMDYFSQKIVAGEVGSSAMPHKVNPIDFENAEGNAGVAISLLEHLSAKLPVSRLQRDLSDSTVLRNIGVPVAHLLIALKSSIKGLGKISLNEHKISKDLENNMMVVAEAIQTVLRTTGYPNPYEALKSLTRKNTAITKEDLSAFIEELDIPEEVKMKLRTVSPFNYTGIIPGRIE